MKPKKDNPPARRPELDWWKGWGGTVYFNADGTTKFVPRRPPKNVQMRATFVPKGPKAPKRTAENPEQKKDSA